MSSNHGRRYLVSKIQDGSQLTGSTYISISKTVKSTVIIPTTNLGYKTRYRCKIVSTSAYNSDRQADISIWPPRPEIIIFVELWQIASKFKRQIRDFRWCPARQKIIQMIATTIDCQKLHDWRAKRLFVIFGYRSLSQSPGVSLFVLDVVKTPDLPLELSSYVTVPYIYVSISRFGAHLGAIYHFRLSVFVAITYQHFIRAPGLTIVEYPGLAVEISTLSVVVPVV